MRVAGVTLALVTALAAAGCSAERTGFLDGTETIGSMAARLVGAPKKPDRKVVFVGVDTGAGINVTAAQATQAVFDTAGAATSLREYIRAASYGQQDLVGDVNVGSLTYPLSASCDTTALATSLKGSVGTYDHYLWYMGDTGTQCTFSGQGVAGTAAAPAHDTWFTSPSTPTTLVLAAELLTNLGLQHSSAITCGTATFANDPSTCTHSEYGDPFSVKGSGARDITAWQKGYLGWLGGCNIAKVRSSGTYTIYPLENPCDGIQALQIPMPATRTFQTETLTSYFIELRGPYGFDSTMSPTVLVRVAGDITASTSVARHTWLLDMNPATTGSQKDGLAVGQTFTDPAGGVSFTLQSIDATKATVQVTMTGSGAPTCMDGSTLPASPPVCAPPADAGTGGTSTTGSTTVGLTTTSGSSTTSTTGRATTGTATTTGATGSTTTSGATTSSTTTSSTTTSGTTTSGATTGGATTSGTATASTTATTGATTGRAAGSSTTGAASAGGSTTTSGTPTGGSSAGATNGGATASTTTAGVTGGSTTNGATGATSSTGGGVTGGSATAATNGAVGTDGASGVSGGATAIGGGNGTTAGASETGDPNLTVIHTGGSCVCTVPGGHAPGRAPSPSGALGLALAAALCRGRRRARAPRQRP